MNKIFKIDTHTHYGFWPTLKECRNNLLYSQDIYNIDFNLVSFDGSEYFSDTNIRNNKINQVASNNKCLDLVKKHPKKFGMLIRIKPHFEKNYKEIENFILQNKKFIYGIKIHPYCSKIKMNNKKIIPYLNIALKYDLPVLVHTANDGYSDLKYLIDVVKKYPNLNFIAAHAVLGTNHNEIIPFLKEYSNLYCDTAWVDPSFVIKLIKNKLIDKVVFGSDNPIDGRNTLSNEIYQKYLNKSFKISKSNYSKLMYLNALKLYKIDINKLK